MASALSIVKRSFPNVTSITDAKRDILVEVTKRDSNSATVKNHKSCAMAVACKRKTDADGVIISLSTAYIVKDNRAIRYRVPTSVSREVVSFDRNGGFEPGEYRLIIPEKSGELGARSKRKNYVSGSRTSNGKSKFHKTDNVRAALSTKYGWS